MNNSFIAKKVFYIDSINIYEHNLIIYTLIGEVLRGDRIVNTLYDVSMNVNQSCRIMCSSAFDAKIAKTLVQRIKDDYSVHLYVVEVFLKKVLVINVGSHKTLGGYLSNCKHLFNNVFIYNKLVLLRV